MKTTSLPTPALHRISAPVTAPAAPTAPLAPTNESHALPVDAWITTHLGQQRPTDEREELRAFAPIAAKLARARAASNVRPAYVEALELHILSSRLASYAFRGQGSPAYDEKAASRELDQGERNPVTNVVAFLAGGKKLNHLSENEITRLIGVHEARNPGPSGGMFSREPRQDYEQRIDERVAAWVTSTRRHLEGEAPASRTSAPEQSAPTSAPVTSRPATSRPAPREQPLASVLGVRVFIEGETQGRFRDTRSGVQKWRDLEPL